MIYTNCKPVKVRSLFNTLAPERFLSDVNFIRWLSINTGKKNQFLLYKPCGTPVALINLMYLSSPSCVVRNTRLHSTGNCATNKRYSTVTHLCLSRYWNLLSGGLPVTHMVTIVLRHTTFRRVQKIRIYNKFSLPILFWGNGTWRAKAEMKYMWRPGQYMERL